MIINKAGNTKILSNTVFLYFRMIITTIITLLSTRIVLRNLGIIDFGIYNVVAGVIMLLAFVNNAMTSSTQRHLSFDMANRVNVQNTFNASFRIHILLAIGIFIIGNILGSMFVRELLNIPEARLNSAMIVYHCVLLIFVVNICSIPFQAFINAKEDMHIIAITGIIESFGRLACAYCIVFMDDRLSAYSSLMVVLAACVACVYMFYSLKKYSECRIGLNSISKEMYKKLAFFAGWTIFGSLASLIKKQGATIVLNIFFGPVINAAFGIANQIANQIGIFSLTVLKAVNPAIVKNYGEGDRDKMIKLMFVSSRFSLYLFSLIAIPLFLEMNYILKTWLDEVPEYTLVFSRVIIIGALIETIIGPLITAIQATARIKYYQLCSGSIFLLNLPVMYILLRIGLGSVTVIVSNICFTVIVGVVRLIFLRSLIGLSLRSWIGKVFINGIVVVLSIFICNLPIYFAIDEGFVRLISILFTTVLSTIVFVYYIGAYPDERLYINNILKNVLQRRFSVR
ncbi:hypothetical protein EYV94_08020 [Puteibacter caeruleilacunae]|nr:hypothetical protein EYV94_08020 [Puteibacter caeruleilacunae]